MPGRKKPQRGLDVLFKDVSVTVKRIVASFSLWSYNKSVELGMDSALAVLKKSEVMQLQCAAKLEFKHSPSARLPEQRHQISPSNLHRNGERKNEPDRRGWNPS